MPDVVIENGVSIRNAIIAEGCVIRAGAKIGRDVENGERRISVIGKEKVITEGAVIEPGAIIDGRGRNRKQWALFSRIFTNSKMGDLTWERTSGSIPFGGRYRQIDFVLSNMSNSGIRNIGIITKYNYQSLMDHLANCEDWDLHLGENVRFLPPA